MGVSLCLCVFIDEWRGAWVEGFNCVGPPSLVLTRLNFPATSVSGTMIKVLCWWHCPAPLSSTEILYLHLCDFLLLRCYYLSVKPWTAVSNLETHSTTPPSYLQRNMASQLVKPSLRESFHCSAAALDTLLYTVYIWHSQWLEEESTSFIK